MISRNALRVAAAGAATALSLATAPLPTQAHTLRSVSSSGSAVCAKLAEGVCCVETGLRVKAADVRVPFRGIPVFKNGPGGEVSLTRTLSGTSSYSVEVGVETEVGAILAKAKASISAGLTLSNTTSTSMTYTHAISNGKYGNAQYVSFGKRVTWSKVRTNADCGTTVLSSGVIRFPSSSEGWYYWETTS